MTNDTLNQVLAASAVVTGLATVVVAVFSVGTLRLFTLEKGKEAAKWVRLVAHLARLVAETDTLVKVSEEMTNAGGAPNVERLRARFEMIARNIGTSWQHAAELGIPKTLAHLHVAEVTLESAQDALLSFETEASHPGGPGVNALKQIVEGELIPQIRRCARAVRGAYDAIPEKRRNLKGSDYQDLLDQAATTAIESE